MVTADVISPKQSILVCSVRELLILPIFSNRNFTQFFDPLHGHSEHFKHLRKLWFRRYSYVESSTSNERAWPFSGCSQWIRILAHIPSCSLGSYYPISVELSSPKLCAYKSKPGPRLLPSQLVVDGYH